MRFKFAIIGLTSILAAVMLAACGGAPSGGATPAPKPTLEAVRAGGKVIAQAKVVPVQTAALSMATGGIVAEITAAEGTAVQAGQVIVRLSNKQQAAAVAAAEAAWNRAQARLNELKAGARPQEIASAEAAYKRAEARLAELKAGPRPQEVAAAEASVAAAKAARAKLDQGALDQQIIEAQANLANALAALKQAQTAYDQAGGASNPYVGMLPTTLQLEQATNNYNAAKARLEALQQGARPAEIAAADAEVQRAMAELDQVKAGARPETIAAAEQDVVDAQAHFDLVKAGARSETIAAAEQDVAAAKADLDRARAVLADTELRAPFAGTLASVDVHVGEQVSTSTSIVRLADLSAWQVETTDLTEISAVRVREGDTVVITFDALSGFELPGKVSRIRTIGENRQGDIVYTVIVKPDRSDERLRWNMTAQVSIEPSLKAEGK